MITYTGRSVWPPDSENFTGQPPSWQDIAVGLARQIRFAGQTPRLYSVLPHSIVVANIMPPEHRIHGLLHDAPEAILGDVVTTWKHDVTKHDEAHLLGLIYGDFGIEYASFEADEAVKLADYAALRAEAHALGHAQAERWWPRAEFDDLAEEAYRLTVGNVARDKTRDLLIAETAIQVFKEALAAAGVDVGTEVVA
jgi:hypothetical protein